MGWKLNLNQQELVAKGELSTIEIYDNFLTSWQTLYHPNIFKFVDISYQKYEDYFEVKFEHPALSQYQLANVDIERLTWIEKIFLVQQALDIQIQLDEKKIAFYPALDHVLIHKAGSCAWLPPIPKNIIITEKEKKSVNIIDFLLKVLTQNITKEKSLSEIEKQIPFAWKTFVEDFKDEDIKNFPNKLNNFRFLMHQAWLYLMATDIGMRDNFLTEEEYERLSTLSHYLGISDEQRQRLDVIAQKNLLTYEELLEIVRY